MIRPDVLAAIEAEAVRAREKYGAESIHHPFLAPAQRYAVLESELREVADAYFYTYPIDHPHGLRAELVQVAASAIGWLSCLPVPDPPACCGFGCEDCVCDATSCAGTCGNPTHEGRGTE